MKNIKRKKDDLDKMLEKILKDDPSFQEGLDQAGEAWDIAFQIYDLRKAAGLTQTQLAKLVGTKQSNIARIESADYTSYTFTTLEKVTKALNARLEIKIVPRQLGAETKRIKEVSAPPINLQRQP